MTHIPANTAAAALRVVEDVAADLRRIAWVEAGNSGRLPEDDTAELRAAALDTWAFFASPDEILEAFATYDIETLKRHVLIRLQTAALHLKGEWTEE